ncbi:MAG: tectonin domain-containing protein [bacterium]
MKNLIAFLFVLVVSLGSTTCLAQAVLIDSIFVCGTTAEGEIYVFEKGEWQPMTDNLLKAITVNNKGLIWGADFMGTLWRQVGSYGWILYPVEKKVLDISMVKDLIWVIDDSLNTYFFNYKTTKWYPADIKLKCIDVGMNGNVAGISADGKLFKSDYLPMQFRNGPFEEIPFEQKFVDAAGGDISYAITEKGELYFYLGISKEQNSASHEWLKINSEPLSRIDVDGEGTLWAIDLDGNVLSYSDNRWTEYDVELAEIAASGFQSKR